MRVAKEDGETNLADALTKSKLMPCSKKKVLDWIGIARCNSL